MGSRQRTNVFVVVSLGVVLAGACAPTAPAQQPPYRAAVSLPPPPIALDASAPVDAPPPPPPAKTCTPGESFCAEGHVRRCDANGTSSDMVSACAPEAECHLLGTGPACSTCAPGSVPTCEDDATAAACNDDGTQALTDCAAQKKRCLNGVCVDRACDPGNLVCRDGNVYRCNAFGSGSSLETKCRPAEGVCWSDAARKPACRTQCVGVGQNTVLATFNCAECDWSSVAFCATKGPDRGCGSGLCQGGQIGFGADSMPCLRETEGLVVPDSEKAGDCQGSADVGTTTIAYQVCRGGNAVAATRKAPCRKSGG